MAHNSSARDARLNALVPMELKRKLAKTAAGQGKKVSALVRESIEEGLVMDYVEIGPSCRTKKAIIEKHIVIPPGTSIGIDPWEDRMRFDATPRGGIPEWIAVVPKRCFAQEV